MRDFQFLVDIFERFLVFSRHSKLLDFLVDIKAIRGFQDIRNLNGNIKMFLLLINLMKDLVRYKLKHPVAFVAPRFPVCELEVAMK